MRKFLMASAAAVLAAGAANAQPVKPVAPGTVVVHLNGYLQAGLDVYGSSKNVGTGYKLNSVSTNGDARLYAGFDGLTINGIGYGAQVELRTAKSDANEGANATTGSKGTAGLEGIYVKRAYGYVGMPQFGYVRLGQTDSAFTLLQTGVIEAFGDGSQWTGDGTALLVLPQAVSNPFIYADQSALYATDKIVYVSPALADEFGGKFSFSFGFEPNSNGLKGGYGAPTGSTAAALSSTDVSFAGTNLAKERQNTYDVAGAYAINLDGFNTKANVALLDGSPIRYTGSTAGSLAQYNLDALQVLQFGIQTTYAGVTLGANVKWGQTLDGYAPKVVGTRNALSYIVGGNYVLGPYVIGASYFNEQSAGSYFPGNAGVAKTETQYGVAVGGNYVISKDLSLYAQYLYDHQHQPGVSFNGFGTKTGNGQSQVLSMGGTWKW